MTDQTPTPDPQPPVELPPQLVAAGDQLQMALERLAGDLGLKVGPICWLDITTSEHIGGVLAVASADCLAAGGVPILIPVALPGMGTVLGLAACGRAAVGADAPPSGSEG